VLLHWFKSFFKDELWVFIHPQHMLFLRISRSLNNGSKQKVEYQQVINFPQTITNINNESQDWQILSKYLKQALSHTKWQGTTPTVIVSNHFARYAVIPWNAELAVEAERLAYMQHCFNLVYGEVAKTWDLRMSEPEFGQPTIASAIKLSLLQALHDVFAEASMALTAVNPQLTLAINQTLSEVKKQKKALGFWLVAIQSERVCLTLLINGGWRLVKNVAIETDVSAQVTALIQREIVNCSVHDEIPVLLYWPESKGKQAFTLENHKAIKILPHQFEMQNSKASNSLPDWLPA
jgi:hypothetical protein